MMRWDPFRELRYLRNETEKALDRLRMPEHFLAQEGWGPRIDLFQTEDKVIARVELPGLKTKDDVEVMVSEDSLHLKGELKRGDEVKEGNYYHSERFYGAFSRTLALPAEVQADQATASYQDGVLEVSMPKALNQKHKRVKLDIH